MKHGVFYLLSSETEQENSGLSELEQLVYNLTKSQWRSGKNILITCVNKSQAEKLNNELWDHDHNAFLPHSLLGKNIRNVPIIIYWPQCCYDNLPRDLLINLMHKNMDFFFNFNKIIDFVPTQNDLKIWARKRYKSYKNTGFQLSTLNAPKLHK